LCRAYGASGGQVVCGKDQGKRKDANREIGDPSRLRPKASARQGAAQAAFNEAKVPG
jgi:hypothetical protein